jgi:hypothetical protein
MHTISNKQPIANKKQQQEKRASSVKHEQPTFALEKPPLKGSSFEHSRTSALLESVFGK